MRASPKQPVRQAADLQVTQIGHRKMGLSHRLQLQLAPPFGVGGCSASSSALSAWLRIACASSSDFIGVAKKRPFVVAAVADRGTSSHDQMVVVQAAVVEHPLLFFGIDGDSFTHQKLHIQSLTDQDPQG
jgi:hypothetical protein